MNKGIADIYRLPNIEEYEDVHLLTLSEYCASLEEQVYAIAQALPEQEQQTIQAYMDARNDLELETVRVALRWGKRSSQ